MVLQAAALVVILAGSPAAGPKTETVCLEPLQARANAHVAAGEYEKAITLFEYLFEREADPVQIFNIAVAHDMADHCAKSLEAFERYFALCANASCPHTKVTETRRQRVIEKCSRPPPKKAPPQPSLLTFEVPKRTEIRIDGASIDLSGSGSQPVPSGAHEVSLVLPSRASLGIDVDLDPGESIEVEYVAPRRAWRGWTGGALVGLGAILSVGAVWAFHESDAAADQAIDEPRNLAHLRDYQKMYGWGMGTSLAAGLVTALGLGLGAWALLDPDPPATHSSSPNPQ